MSFWPVPKPSLKQILGKTFGEAKLCFGNVKLMFEAEKGTTGTE
jgi:hypothetical protein